MLQGQLTFTDVVIIIFYNAVKAAGKAVNMMHYDYISFENEKHEKLFVEAIGRCNRQDVETIPVMYLLSLACENMQQLEQCFDFNEQCIDPDCCMYQYWLNSSTAKLAAIRLAFSLWNGFASEDNQINCNVYYLFGNGYDVYFLQAIALRYKITLHGSI